MKPHRAVAPDGTIHVFDPRTGFHEPEDASPERFPYWVNLTLLALALSIGCASAVGVGYAFYRVFEALAS